jgi:hypothetical protein
VAFESLQRFLHNVGIDIDEPFRGRAFRTLLVTPGTVSIHVLDFVATIRHRLGSSTGVRIRVRSVDA